MKSLVESINEAFDLRQACWNEIGRLFKKYKLQGVGIPYYAISNFENRGLRSVDERCRIESYQCGIDVLEASINELENELANGYVVDFKWKGTPHTVLFLPNSGKKVSKGEMIAHFDDDDKTWQTISFKPDKKEFVVYCNFRTSGVDEQFTAKNLKDVKIRKLS